MFECVISVSVFFVATVECVRIPEAPVRVCIPAAAECILGYEVCDGPSNEPVCELVLAYSRFDEVLE